LSKIALSPNASGTGTFTVAAPNTNTDYTLTLPEGTGTVVANNVNSAIVSGTAVASTSGTSIDFTSIPSWVKRVTVMFSGVSLSASANLLIQLGDSGGFENSGYLGAGCYMINGASTVGGNYTTGFGITIGNTNGIVHGSIVITNLSSNTWIASYSGGYSNAAASFAGGGNKTLSDILTQVRVTSTSTDTFDAGTINILYE
jgi:hypothetical protein